MESSPFTASLLRASVDGFAGLAAARLFEGGSSGEDQAGFDAWKQHLRGLVLELAAALESETSERFADSVAWSRGAFSARKLPLDALKAGLDSLRSVLEDSLPPPSHSLLEVYFEEAVGRLEGDHDEDQTFIGEDSPLGLLALDYVAALRACDEAAAKKMVLDALEAGTFGIQEIFEGVLAPALREMGRLWYLGEASVSDEHFATVVTNQVLGAITSAYPRREKNGRTVVLTTVAGEAHSIGIQLVAASFQLDGWQTVCLGANTPVEGFVEFVSRVNADVVLLSATLNTARNAAAAMIAALRAEVPDLIIVVGGAAFSDGDVCGDRLGVDILGVDCATTVARVRAAAGL